MMISLSLPRLDTFVRRASLLASAAGLSMGLAAVAAIGPAAAQAVAPPASAAPDSSVPKTNLDAKPGTLSDKLSDTNGVIKPKGDVDPDMTVGAPQTGTMPVIKPGAVSPGTAK